MGLNKRCFSLTSKMNGLLPRCRILAPLGVRHLGNAARGPPLYDIVANQKIAVEMLQSCLPEQYHTETTPFRAVSYAQFKQQCEALRLFLFAGVTGVVTCLLLFRPPKSSYWLQFSPFRWPKLLWDCMFRRRQQVLESTEQPVDGFAEYTRLVSKK
eukprot:Platyproteum_vivax@DN5764_c0_g1_i1.p1